jgi:hypothetical protein
MVAKRHTGSALAFRALLAACCSVVATLGLSGIATAAPAVPSLEGETLQASGQLFNRAATCDPSGTSTITFHWSGFATGPYPGTFTEDGVVTIGPQTGFGAGRFGFALGQVTQFDASFTIVSPAGTVTGSKHLIAPVPANPFPLVEDQQYPQNTGLCTTFTNLDILGLIGASGDATDLRATLHYEASITSATGGTDSGLSFVEAIEATAQAGIASAGTGAASETFPISDAAPQPQLLTVSPVTATNPVGSSHTVTATVATATAPVAGVTVHFTVTGADNLTGACTTGANGQCDFTYQGPALPGADLIQAYADSNGNGVQDPGEPTASATKAFVLPLSTGGEAHGGGRVDMPGVGRIAFEFHAKSKDLAHAKCTVVTADVTVQCLDATALVITPTHATIFGSATVNGVATNYRIDADDLSEPGAGRDTFKIQTDSGFVAGGTIASGNVQIKQ